LTKVSENPGRLHYIDNLRWSLIVLVIVVHASVTYGPVGGWFYYDRTGTDALTGIFLTWITSLSQAFFMGLMFFLAGYFIPSSLERKGGNRFTADRLRRLGVPTLLFILVIGPGIVYSLYQNKTSFLGYYDAYLLDPARYESGPLWFAIALLVFTLVYVVLRGRVPSIGARAYGNRELFELGVGLALATFLVRLAFPIGSAIWNMQAPFFVQYITLFVLGIAAQRNGWLEMLTDRMGKIWTMVTVVLALSAWPILMLAGRASGDDLTPFMGGFHWQALALALWEQMFCVAASVMLLVWYRRRMNRVTKTTGFLSRNSFAVYAMHTPVLIAVTLLLVPVDLPVIVKFVAAVAMTVTISFPMCEVLRRLPVLNGVF
jgi:glucans biosynthesis protein C